MKIHKMFHGHHWMSRKDEKINNSFDFGWSFAWMNGYWIAGIAIVALACWIFVAFPSLQILSFVLFLLALNLFVGNFAMRSAGRLEFMTLPFVDLFSSDSDLILDAGCGAGRTTIALSKVMKKGRIIALDRFDASYIEGGGRNLLEGNLKIAGVADRVETVQGDVTKLEFEGNKFDSAISSYAIDHLGEYKLAALEEINRVLKDRGKFLLIVLVPNIWTFAIVNILCYHVFTSKKNWRELFKQSGFHLIDEGNINTGAYFLMEKRALSPVT